MVEGVPGIVERGRKPGVLPPACSAAEKGAVTCRTVTPVEREAGFELSMARFDDQRDRGSDVTLRQQKTGGKNKKNQARKT